LHFYLGGCIESVDSQWAVAEIVVVSAFASVDFVDWSHLKDGKHIIPLLKKHVCIMCGSRIFLENLL
jgi:hypothetical protein